MAPMLPVTSSSSSLLHRFPLLFPSPSSSKFCSSSSSSSSSTTTPIASAVTFSAAVLIAAAKSPVFSSSTAKSILFPRGVASHQQQAYVYPDPIPEFARAETERFQSELLKKLSQEKETFGTDLGSVVKVCSEIFSNFLHKEYGGPGTLLVEPFTDMLLALKDRKLPGAPMAARAALLWAQNNVDSDWEFWTSQPPR